jgi:SAM-dependent methyltransferase
LENKALQQRFATIYATDEWGQGSGEGSLPVHTRGYAAFIEGFIREIPIRSVLDVGCGDWQFSRFINWGDCSYHGVDVVPAVIEANRKNFAKDNRSFDLYDGDFSQLPEADLLIIKDVLQHLSAPQIQAFLSILPRYPFALITNCINPTGSTDNGDIPDGEFRYLDLTLPPFNLKAEEVYRFSNHQSLLERLFQKPRWTKKVLLHQR